MGPRVALALGGVLAALAALLLGVHSVAPDSGPQNGQLDPAVVSQLGREGVHLDSRAGQARFCEYAENLPAWARRGPVAGCAGVLTESLARAVAAQYQRRVVGALLAAATGPAGPFGLLMQNRLVWALELDRYIGSIYTWDFLHPGCQAGHAFLFLDAYTGQPVGEVAWGRQADLTDTSCP